MAEHARQPVVTHGDLPQTAPPDRVALLDWIRKPRPGSAVGTLNACYNALDRHVIRGLGDRTALVHAGATSDAEVRWSFAEVLERTAAFAGALRGLGAGPAERVLLRVPRVPEAVVATLACARIGAVATVLAGDAAPEQLSVRLDTAGVVIRRAGRMPGEPGDVDWETAMRAGAADPAACLDVDAAAPLYALRTIDGELQVRPTGRHAADLAWSMQHRLGVRAGQVWWSTWPLGSAIGLDHAIFGPLLAGATTVLHADGPAGTTDPDTFRRVVSDHRVEAVLTDAATVQALVEGGHSGARRGDLSLRAIYVAGDRLQPDVLEVAHDVLGVPVAAFDAGS